MLIRLGYDIHFQVSQPLALVAQLRVHPSRIADLREPDILHVEGGYGGGQIESHQYSDTYGNLCTRIYAPRGPLRLWTSTLIEDSGQLDPIARDPREIPTQELPDDVLIFLLNSRYCEVDLLSGIAVELFGGISPGWNRVQAICDWVHNKVTFNYNFARPTKTALDVFTERIGVCRDFQHLAVTFCRCLNI